MEYTKKYFDEYFDLEKYRYVPKELEMNCKNIELILSAKNIYGYIENDLLSKSSELKFRASCFFDEVHIEY